MPLPTNDMPVPTMTAEVMAEMVAQHRYKDVLPGPLVWHVLSKHKKLKDNTKIALMMVLVDGLPNGYAADQCGLEFTSMDTLVCKYKKEVRDAIAAGEVPVTNTDELMAEMLAHPERYTHVMRIVEE